MAGVKSRIVMNVSALRKLSQAHVTALEKTAEALHTEIGQSEIVPMDEGALSGEQFHCDYSESSKGKVSLVHSTPYARRLYFHPEFNFQKHEHAFAQGEWFTPWLKGGISEDFAQKAFEKFYKREADI